MIQERIIADGIKGTSETIKQMWSFVDKATGDETLILISTDIAKSAAFEKDYLRRATALFNWVKKTIAYFPDPHYKELVQDPFFTIARGAGDCDDHTVLLAAMAQSIGYPVRFKTIGRSMNEFKHVYPEIFINGSWMPADTTESQSYLGWDPAAGTNYIQKIWNNPILEPVTEGGIMFGAYEMTAGEQLVYRDLTIIIDSVKDWTTLTGWNHIANDRQRIANVKASAEKNLSDPKKIDAVTRLGVMGRIQSQEGRGLVGVTGLLFPRPDTGKGRYRNAYT